MSTFLQLVANVHRECSISGEAPGSVVNQSGLIAKLVAWTADAAYEIEALHGDWNFMWAQWSESTIVGTPNYSAPADLGEWDRESFFLNYSATTHKRLNEMDYREWRDSLRNGSLTNAKSDYFVILPNKSVTLHAPPDAVYTLTADYWMTPTRMSANTDTSNVPVQYERAIVALAKIKYAEDRGDQVMLANAQTDYLVWLEKLEAGELPGQERRRKSTPEPMVVIPE